MSERHHKIPNWPHLRRVALDRADWRCEWTQDGGERCRARHNLECDHIHPLHKGGTNNPDNLQILCRRHHIMKTRMERGISEKLVKDQDGFRAWVEELKSEARA